MTKRVLIVDESLTIRMELAEAFSEAGFEPVPCPDIAGAEQAMLGKTYDLAIVAIEDAQGATALIQRLKDSVPSPAVLLLAGHQHQGALAGDADLVVEPPHDSESVVAQALELLDRRPRVLLIDDSATFRHELGHALQKAGYCLLTAESGEQGLRLAFEHNPAAIIVDNVLPGMDGVMVLRRLRQNPATRRTPCLLLTASEDRQQELRALEAGADTFVRKSQDLEVVLACLSAAMRSASTPAALERRSGQTGRQMVMVVDNDAEFAAALSRALQDEGHSVTVCAAGDVSRAAASPVTALVFGPDAGEIREFIDQVRSYPHTSAARIIIAGQSDDRSAIISFLNSGVDDYVLKSTGMDVLVARVRAQIRRKQVEDENRDIRESILRRELEARAQAEVAAARAVQAVELRQAKELAEAKAREAEHAVAQNEAIFSSLGEGIIICTLDGKVAYVNDAALRMHRLDRQNVVGRHISTLVTIFEARYPDGRPIPENERPMKRALRGESLSGMEAYLYRADLNYGFIGSFNVTPVRTPDGHQILGAITVRDITAQKKAEEALRRTEKLAATGRLAASIAHEINNPLAAVTNLLYLLQGTMNSNPVATEYLLQAQREVERVAQIARQTLAFYRDSSDPVEVDLCDLVAEVVRVYATKAQNSGLVIHPELDCRSPIKGFPGELRQVISNLVANAIDASPKGAAIRIRVRDGVDWCDAARHGTRVTVFNGGPGIPRQIHSQLFKPFFTTKGHRGTGLGLWLSSSIVEKHQGSIRFRTSDHPGRSGTAFSVFFPAGAEVRPDYREDIAQLFQAVGRELLDHN